MNDTNDAEDRKAALDFQYLRLADKIESRVAEGGFRAGERLPSLRSLHAETGLSLSTVYRAYVELETRGVVEPREKSGFYVRPLLRNILPLPGFDRRRSKPNRVSVNVLVDAIMELLGDPAMLPLGAAIPAPELLPVKQLVASMKAVSNMYTKKNFIALGPPDGTPELKRQIARRSVSYHQKPETDGIIITNGCMEAIQLCLRAVAGPGDTILVESPTFTCYLQLIEDLNMLALEVPTDPEHGVDLASLAKAVAEHDVKACILNPNFQNPLGFEMSDAHKKELVELLGGKEIPVIEDDIYSELYYGDARPRTLKSFDRKGLVLYCSSFSKSLAPDLRVGWTMPGRYIDRVRRLKFNSTIASSKLNQLVVADFLNNSSYDRHLRKLRNALKNQAANTALAIARHFPPQTKISAPKGGIILWVQLDETVDGMEVFQEAREHKIFVLPGIISSTTDAYSNCIRISCGTPWNEKMEEGIKTLGEIVAGKVGVRTPKDRSSVAEA
jgi:DNA-binding transcriptional MocR family regulator